MSRNHILLCVGVTPIATCVLAVTWWSRHRTQDQVGILLARPDNISVHYAEEGPNTRIVDVELVNEGPSTLKIEDVQTSSSCPCALADRLSQTLLNPGDHTKLRLRLTPPRYGQEEQMVFVRTNSPTRPIITIPVRLNGLPLEPPLIVHQPDDIELVGHVPGELVSRSIQLTTTERADEEPWVLSLGSESGTTEAELESAPTTTPQGGGLVLRTYSFRIQTGIPEDQIAPVVDRLRIVTRDNGPGERRDILVRTYHRPLIRLVPEEMGSLRQNP